jgi:SAM-dependent methyltransferase
MLLRKITERLIKKIIIKKRVVLPNMVIPKPDFLQDIYIGEKQFFHGWQAENSLFFLSREGDILQLCKVSQPKNFPRDLLCLPIASKEGLINYSGSSYFFKIFKSPEISMTIFAPDFILALLELRSAGAYPSKIQISSYFFSKRLNSVLFLGHENFLSLPSHVSNLNPGQYLSWWLQEADVHMELKKIIKDYMRMMPEGRLDLSHTSLLKSQRTTNSDSGIYHSYDSSNFTAKGSRDLSDRKSTLDKIGFKDNERVLDIGCNMGLLCHYLEARRCCPTGFELDDNMVKIANLISRIEKKSSTFYTFDLDNDQIAHEFDTIFLFSVFHHTKNLIENGHKIAKSARRIVIECRLVEKGRKPSDSQWEATSSWNFKTLEDLKAGLLNFFPGFKTVDTVGESGKHRYIFEIKK